MRFMVLTKQFAEIWNLIQWKVMQEYILVVEYKNNFKIVVCNDQEIFFKIRLNIRHTQYLSHTEYQRLGTRPAICKKFKYHIKL